MKTATRNKTWKLAVCTAAIAWLCMMHTGCSLFVMAGKMFWGDPKLTSEFRQKTGINLTKSDETLLVVCSTPESVKSTLPSLEVDLIDGITRNLNRNGIHVVKPDKVARWIDEHGGTLGAASELAREFSPDFIAQIEIERFSLEEQNSPTMLRGRAGGSVSVYEVTTETGELSSIFSGSFSSEYPHLYPVSVGRITHPTFQHDFVKHLTTQLSRFFYDYRFRDEF